MNLNRKKKPVGRYEDWGYFSSVVDQLRLTSYDEGKGIGVWEDAMKEEILALKKNKTWDLVP